MGATIGDGKGRGFQAEVTSEQHLVVDAVTQPELEHASVEEGKAFSWDSTERDIDVGDTMLFVKNTGEAELHLDYALVNGSNVICTWDIGIGSTTTTPAGGTEITPVNLNETFTAKVADAVARSDETAVADAAVILRVKTAVDETVRIQLNGVVLGQDHYIQFNQETESTRGSVILVAHFE